MSFVLYSRGTSTTGRLLARTLGIPGGTELPARGNRQAHLIRWGSSQQVRRRPRHVINKRNGILAVTDKFGSLITFSNNHVPAPRAARLTEDVARTFRYPALARRTNHQQGRDVMLCLQTKDGMRALRQNLDYLVEYIPTRTEYRIHVIGNEMVRASQKLLRNDRADNYVPWLRNHDHGYIFGNVRGHIPAALVTGAIDAVKSVGLDFGAVDMIVADDGRWYILEVNTGPGLVASSMQTYAERLSRMIGLERIHMNVIEEMRQNQTEEQEERAG
jgi:glutathione synthase/RimK-type ligase-like ATP-grasp enzyme